ARGRDGPWHRRTPELAAVVPAQVHGMRAGSRIPAELLPAWSGAAEDLRGFGRLLAGRLDLPRAVDRELGRDLVRDLHRGGRDGAAAAQALIRPPTSDEGLQRCRPSSFSGSVERIFPPEAGLHQAMTVVSSSFGLRTFFRLTSQSPCMSRWPSGRIATLFRPFARRSSSSSSAALSKPSIGVQSTCSLAAAISAKPKAMQA